MKRFVYCQISFLNMIASIRDLWRLRSFFSLSNINRRVIHPIGFDKSLNLLFFIKYSDNAVFYNIILKLILFYLINHSRDIYFRSRHRYKIAYWKINRAANSIFANIRGSQITVKIPSFKMIGIISHIVGFDYYIW